MTTAELTNKTNTIERIRLEVGLTDPQMLKAIGAKRGQSSLLTAADQTISPAFLERAEDLHRAYQKWVEDLKVQVTDLGENRGIMVNGVSCLTAMQAATVLGIEQFNVVKLAERGLIGSILSSRRYYPVQSVLDFIDANSKHLNDGKRSRAPLATAFLNSYEESFARARLGTPRLS